MFLSNKKKGTVIRQLYDYLDSDPDNNIPKALDWLGAHDKKGA